MRPTRFVLFAGFVALVGLVGVGSPFGPRVARGDAGDGSGAVRVEQETTRVSYVVFHATDRDGFCDSSVFGAVSLHPVLTDAPNDTLFNGTTGNPNPRATLDVYIDSGVGVIVETSDGPAPGARFVAGLKTFSTFRNAEAGSPRKAFAPLHEGVVDECQAWVKIVSSLPGPTNVLLIFHDDTGDIGFDRIINGQRRSTLTLQPRWSLLTWSGADGIAPSEALTGTGAAAGGTDVSGSVGAIYAWDSAAAKWLAYFPGAGAVPGANTLTTLDTGRAYWFAVSRQSPLEWSFPSN